MEMTTPQNLEAEQSLLGSLLVNNDAIALVSPIVQPEHFFEGLHARIYDAIRTMQDKGAAPSALTLRPLFDSDATMKELGGSAYLSALVSNAMPLQAEAHARQIRDLANRRAVIANCEMLMDEAANPTADDGFKDSIASHVSELSAMVDGATTRKHTFSAVEAYDKVIAHLDRLADGKPDKDAIPTGIQSLDEITGGLRRGTFNVIGGRPGMGKSAFALQLAINACDRKHGVIMFSLEMSAQDIGERLTASRLWMPEHSFPYACIRNNSLTEKEARWVREARGSLDLNLRIDERGGLSAADIEAAAKVKCADLKRQGIEPGIVIIDHMQRVTGPARQANVEKFTAISAKLAELAKATNTAVVCLSQLNREVEKRPDKRPTLSDLRETGAIEQDADLVAMAYRPAYYVANDPAYADEIDRQYALVECLNDFQLIIEKNRAGPTSTLDLYCDIGANVFRDPRDIPNLAVAA